MQHKKHNMIKTYKWNNDTHTVNIHSGADVAKNNCSVIVHNKRIKEQQQTNIIMTAQCTEI